MSLEEHLAAARAANQHVFQKMPYGAGNRFDDRRTSWGLSAFWTLLNRVQYVATGTRPTDNGHWVQILAAQGEYWKAGNCMEMSSIALIYLLGRGVRPVEWMALTNLDHAFVVIGRQLDSQPSEYWTWGDEAVVCDPWDKDVYEARFFNYRMHRGQEPCFQYRGHFSPKLLASVVD